MQTTILHRSDSNLVAKLSVHTLDNFTSYLIAYHRLYTTFIDYCLTKIKK